MAGIANLHPVGEHQHPDRGTDEIIAMDQCVDQQFLKHDFRDFQDAQAVDALIALNVKQVALDECQTALVLPGQSVENALAIQIARSRATRDREWRRI